MLLCRRNSEIREIFPIYLTIKISNRNETNLIRIFHRKYELNMCKFLAFKKNDLSVVAGEQ